MNLYKQSLYIFILLISILNNKLFYFIKFKLIIKVNEHWINYFIDKISFLFFTNFQTKDENAEIQKFSKEKTRR